MQLTTEYGLKALANAKTVFLELFKHGSLSVEIYKPGEKDNQQPHDRDEVYIIISGTGNFFSGGKTAAFQPGDFLFVPAGVEHRFKDFTTDFATWVIFYGPSGGEAISCNKK
jgi:mannose-6-phosphate isomerase-like protein (cupin superfamily)